MDGKRCVETIQEVSRDSHRRVKPHPIGPPALGRRTQPLGCASTRIAVHGATNTPVHVRFLAADRTEVDSDLILKRPSRRLHTPVFGATVSDYAQRRQTNPILTEARHAGLLWDGGHGAALLVPQCITAAKPGFINPRLKGPRTCIQADYRTVTGTTSSPRFRAMGSLERPSFGGPRVNPAREIHKAGTRHPFQLAGGGGGSLCGPCLRSST